MLTYRRKYNETLMVSFKCRLCKAYLSTPDELRVHSMVAHKGHMLIAIKN